MPALSASLVAATRAWREALASETADARLYEGVDALAIAEELAIAEKMCAAARARFAARAAACGAHKSAGHTDAADWLARAMGTSLAAARDALDVGSSLDECPQTAEALAAGRLSLAQAKETTATERDHPGSETELLGVAARGGLRSLQDAALAKRLESRSFDQIQAERRAARSVKTWRDNLGMVNLHAVLAPEVGLAIINRLEHETRRRWRDAGGAAGAVTTFEQHAADAFVAMINGEAGGGKGPTDLAIVCNLDAWRRGHTHPGEPCHLIGGGPIPVELARELADDAFLKAVIHDGVAIHTVKHFGRHIPAEVRTALDLGAPPQFAGRRCAEAGCDRALNIDWDHHQPLAAGGATEYANLQGLCGRHHRAKTDAERAAGTYANPARGDPDQRSP